MCQSSGEWGSADFSSCTMRLSATPFIMMEVKGFDSDANVTGLSNQVQNCSLLLISISVIVIYKRKPCLIDT